MEAIAIGRLHEEQGRRTTHGSGPRSVRTWSAGWTGGGGGSAAVPDRTADSPDHPACWPCGTARPACRAAFVHVQTPEGRGSGHGVKRVVLGR